MGTVVKIDDGIIAEFGKILQTLYEFAKSINFQWFSFTFSLWDIFIAGCVLGVIAILWYGFTD